MPLTPDSQSESMQDLSIKQSHSSPQLVCGVITVNLLHWYECFINILSSLPVRVTMRAVHWQNRIY